MELSLIIPTHTPGDYLFDCLKSIQSQCLEKHRYEVIIVLNGKQHPYYEKIESYITYLSSMNIILLYSNIAGVSHARNIGLNNAKGMGIIFIDDDDAISPHYLKDLLAKQNGNSIVLTNLKTFETCVTDTKYEQLTWAFERLAYKPNITILASRKFFNNVCGKYISMTVIGNTRFDESMKNSEDSVFMVEISANISKIGIASPSTVYLRRLRRDSASRRYRPFRERLGTTMYAINKNISFYCRSHKKYSGIFVAARILASLRGLITDGGLNL